MDARAIVENTFCSHHLFVGQFQSQPLKDCKRPRSSNFKKSTCTCTFRMNNIKCLCILINLNSHCSAYLYAISFLNHVILVLFGTIVRMSSSTYPHWTDLHYCKCICRYKYIIASGRESEATLGVSSVRTLTPWSESGLPGNIAGLSGALVTLATCGWDGDSAFWPVDPIVNPDSPEPGEKLEPETKVSLYYFYFVIFLHDTVVLLQLWLF